MTSALGDPAEIGFDAFISYSHAADEALAAALQRALHRFARPLLRLRALRVFRDDENLAANANLDTAIEDALARSRFFILLASPQAAGSHWVAQEVEWWLRNRSPDRLLICLTAGAIAWDGDNTDFDWSRTTALPRALSAVYAAEPRYARLDRVARDPTTISLENAAFRDAVRDLAAPIHGLSRDALESEDIRLRRRAMRITRMMAAVLVVLTVLSMTSAWVATRERDVARHQARVANSRRLAAAATALRETDPDNGRRLASEALRASPTAEAAAAYAATAFRAGLEHEIGRASSLKVLTINPHGRLAVTASQHEMAIVDLLTGRVVRRLADPMPWRWISSIGFNNSSSKIVAVDAYSTMAVWSVATGHRSMSTVAPGSPLAELSPNGRRIITTAGRHGETALWDAATGLRIHSLGKTSYIASAFSGRGLVVAIANIARPRVKLLDGVTGRRLAEIRVPLPGNLSGVGVNALSFSPDGRSLALALDYGVGVWSGSHWNQTLRLAGFRDYDVFRTVSFSEDGRFLIAGGDDNEARVWSWPSGRLIAVLHGDSGSIADAEIDRHDQFAATASNDGTARLWSLRTGALLATYRAGSAAPDGVWFTPNSEHLVTFGVDDIARVWRVPVTILRGSQGSVRGAIFTQDDRRIVSVGADGTGQLWNIRTGQELETVSPAGPDGTAPDFIGVSADASSRVVLLQAGYPYSYAWNLQTDKVTHLRTNSNGSSVISPSGRFVGTTDLGGIVKVWRTRDGKLIRSLRVGDATELRLNSAGNVMATDPIETSLRVWDWRSGKLLDVLPAAGRGYARSVFDPAANLLAVAEWESSSTRTGLEWRGYVRIWNWHTGKLQRRLDAGVGPIVNDPPVFSPDGERLLAMSGNTIYVWQTATGKPIARFGCEEREIGTAHFDASGRYVIAVCSDSAAHIFDVSTGDELARLSDHRGEVTDASFSPHDRWLLTAGADGEIHVYPCNFCRSVAAQHH